MRHSLFLLSTCILGLAACTETNADAKAPPEAQVEATDATVDAKPTEEKSSTSMTVQTSTGMNQYCDGALFLDAFGQTSDVHMPHNNPSLACGAHTVTYHADWRELPYELLKHDTLSIETANKACAHAKERDAPHLVKNIKALCKAQDSAKACSACK